MKNKGTKKINNDKANDTTRLPWWLEFVRGAPTNPFHSPFVQLLSRFLASMVDHVMFDDFRYRNVINPEGLAYVSHPNSTHYWFLIFKQEDAWKATNDSSATHAVAGGGHLRPWGSILQLIVFRCRAQPQVQDLAQLHYFPNLIRPKCCAYIGHALCTFNYLCRYKYRIENLTPCNPISCSIIFVNPLAIRWIPNCECLTLLPHFGEIPESSNHNKSHVTNLYAQYENVLRVWGCMVIVKVSNHKRKTLCDKGLIAYSLDMQIIPMHIGFTSLNMMTL